MPSPTNKHQTYATILLYSRFKKPSGESNPKEEDIYAEIDPKKEKKAKQKIAKDRKDNLAALKMKTFTKNKPSSETRSSTQTLPAPRYAITSVGSTYEDVNITMETKLSKETKPGTSPPQQSTAIVESTYEDVKTETKASATIKSPQQSTTSVESTYEDVNADTGTKASTETTPQQFATSIGSAYEDVNTDVESKSSAEAKPTHPYIANIGSPYVNTAIDRKPTSSDNARPQRPAIPSTGSTYEAVNVKGDTMYQGLDLGNVNKDQVYQDLN